MIIDLIAHFRRIRAWQFALRIGLTHARIPQRLRRALGIQNRRTGFLLKKFDNQRR